MKRRLVPYAGQNGSGGCKDIGAPLKEMFASYEAAGLSFHAHNFHISAVELQKLRWRSDQPDTRDLTGRICGDPVPGRRALDMRGAK